jgi:hypothetical protein
MRDDFVDARRESMVDLARQLGAGTLTTEWQAAMRGEIKMAVGASSTPSGAASWPRRPRIGQKVEDLVAEQWDYLDGFADDT